MNVGRELPASAPGLADVVATRTRLSRVDGAAGELVIAGHRVEDLAFGSGFESVCHLLWHGELPDEATVATLRAALGHARVAAHEHFRETRFLPLADPMDSLRSALARFEASTDVHTDARLLVGAVPVANAWWWAWRNGRPAPAPRPDLSHAADLVRLVAPAAAEAAASALERYLVTVSDHGMNASTFAARVIASTRSDIVSAVVGAVGALKGPLHGGAPGPVLDMLDAIGDASNARAWLSERLAAGERIMGMGHRVYRVRDPRAAVFERTLTEIQAGPAATGRLELARAVEMDAEDLLAARYPQRPLKANVEFYTAVLLEAAGIPRPLFAATFAAGRAAGWIAHYLEQREEDHLIRPLSAYIGAEPAPVPA